MGKLAKIAIVGSLGMVGVISAMQSVGSELEAEFAEQATAEAGDSSVGALADAEVASDGVAASLPQQAKQTAAKGSTLLEQAILDAFPAGGASDEQKVSSAAGYVAMAINLKGHLCAQPVEMRIAAEGQYGIGCVKYRNGEGAAIYLVDARTGNVTEI